MVKDIIIWYGEGIIKFVDKIYPGVINQRIFSCNVGLWIWPRGPGYVVHSIWEIWRWNDVRGNTVQVSGNTPGPIQQQLTGYLMERQEGAEGLGVDGKGTAAGGIRYPCVRNVLSTSGEISSVVWLIIVGHVGGNDEDCGGNPYKIPKSDHGEEGT